MSPDPSALPYLFFETRPPHVLGGPFAGMLYVERSAGSELLPKLLGCYEQELHGVWAALFRRQPAQVLNIGCGEGYYAVGLARRLPEVRVLASDPDAAARSLCEEMARKNGVAGRVTVDGAWDCERLASLIAPGSLLVCDCEGAEQELLKPDRVPQLQDADLLVELHDFAVRGITETMLARFSPTHRITLIEAEERPPELLGRLLERVAASDERVQVPQCWDREACRQALSENRPPGMRWAVMLAHSRCPTPLHSPPATQSFVP